MPSKSTRVLAVLVLMSVAGSTMAASRFVSDQLSINLRKGPGTQFHIKTLVQAGTRVDVLETDNGWSKVQTSDGSTGFVLSRFLSDQPAARMQVAGMKNKVAALTSQNADLKTKLASAEDSTSNLGDAKRKLVTENTSLKQQLEHIKKISANAVNINQENQALHKKLAAAQQQAKQLQSSNKAHENRRQGMKVGAVILIVGILLGLIVPLLRRKKRSSW